jgi:hypothetical protein
MEVSGQFQTPTALPLEKESLYWLDLRLDGPQSRYGSGGEEKTLCPCQDLKPGGPARNLVGVPTSHVYRYVNKW